MTYSGFHLADRQGALRLFQNLLPLLYATHDLHSDGVTQTELYLFLFAFARLASGSLHIGHTVPQGYHPFRKRYNAAGPLDNDVRIGRVSCPEGCAVGICDGDFNREDRGIVKLLRFEGNSGDTPSINSPGRAPILISAGIPSAILPTSISSTVPLKRSFSIPARLIRGVPAW